MALDCVVQQKVKISNNLRDNFAANEGLSGQLMLLLFSSHGAKSKCMVNMQDKSKDTPVM